MPVEKECNLMQRITLLPVVPHQRLLGVGVVDPLPALHPQHARRLCSYPCVASIIWIRDPKQTGRYPCEARPISPGQPRLRYVMT